MLKEFAQFVLGLNKTGEAISVDGHNPILIQGTSLVGVEEHAKKPYRAKVSETFVSMQAFIAYLQAFKTPLTVITGSVGEGNGASATFKATLNYHGRPENTDADGVINGKGGELSPEWADQIASFTVPLDPDFKAWLQKDGQTLDQRELYNFLVDYAPQFQNPKAENVLTIAGKMKVVGNLESTSNVQGGNLDTLVKETKMLTAGDGVEIPEVWEVALPVFRGIKAKYLLGFRILWNRDHRDGVQFRLKLVRPHLLVEAAFNDACADITKATGITVFGGDPEGVSTSEPTAAK